MGDADLLLLSLVAVVGVCLTLVVTAVRRVWALVADRRRNRPGKPPCPPVRDSRGAVPGSRGAVPKSRGAVRRALRRLARSGVAGRARAADTLGLLGSADAVASLVDRLTDRSPDVRNAAVRALGRIGDPTAAAALLTVLDGPYRVPTQGVVRALVGFGPVTAPDLVPALRDPSDVVRAEVAGVLGLLRAPSAAPPLIRVLTEDASTDVRARAAKALGLIGHPAALAPLVAAVGSGQPAALRPAAATALGELGAAGAVPVLVGLLGDPAHAVADAAALALFALGPIGRTALEDLERSAPVDRCAAYAVAALSVARLADV